MKIRIEADGTVEIDVNGGDAQAAVALIRQLQTEAATPAARVVPPVPTLTAVPVAAPRVRANPFVGSYRQETKDPAPLTPKQRRIYEMIAQFDDGCHYSVLLPELKPMTPKAVNSACNRLCNDGYVTRPRDGVYRVYRGEGI